MRGGRITKSVASVSGNKARSRSPFHIVKPLKSGDNKEKETFKKGRTFHSRCVGRSNNNANANGGLVYSNANNASSNSNTNNSSRLTLRNKTVLPHRQHNRKTLDDVAYINLFCEEGAPRQQQTKVWKAEKSRKS